MRCKDIGLHLQGRTVAILAWVITRKQVDAVQERGRDGKALPEPLIRPMAFGTLEDESGTVEATWFPDVYRACGPLIERGEPCWVQGQGRGGVRGHDTGDHRGVGGGGPTG